LIRKDKEALSAWEKTDVDKRPKDKPKLKTEESPDDVYWNSSQWSGWIDDQASLKRDDDRKNRVAKAMGCVRCHSSKRGAIRAPLLPIPGNAKEVWRAFAMSQGYDLKPRMPIPALTDRTEQITLFQCLESEVITRLKKTVHDLMAGQCPQNN